MLGYITIQDRAPGAADRLLRQTARHLAAAGLRLAGAVQINTDHGPDRDCDMDLRILGDDGPALRISQSLGPGSQACRLDAGAMAQAVARTQAALDRGADLLIINKFGKQECHGRGFRDTIAQALGQGIPVLLHVPDEQLPGFHDFAGDLAEHVTPDGIATWCRHHLPRFVA